MPTRSVFMGFAIGNIVDFTGIKVYNKVVTINTGYIVRLIAMDSYYG